MSRLTLRQPSSVPHGSFTTARSLGIGLLVALATMSGCVAQQADLARVQKDLEDQIAQLNLEKTALEGEISQDREEAATLKEQQQAAMKDLFRARAEIRQELKALREADLTALTGDIETLSFRVKKLQKDLDAQSKASTTRFQAVETQIDRQNETLVAYGKKHDVQGKGASATDARLTELIQQIDTDSDARNKESADFHASLSAFKGSLEGLGGKIVEETERARLAETNLEAQIGQRGDELTAALEAVRTKHGTSMDTVNAELQVHGANIQEVSDSVKQLRGAVTQSGTLFGTNVDQLSTTLTQVQTDQQEMEQHLNTLTNKLNTDTQALKTYLESDVKSSMQTMTTTFAEQQQPLMTRVEAVQGKLQGLEGQSQANTSQVQELTQSVLQLKEGQEVMGALLGERGDKLIQESGRLTERLNLIEAHQSELTGTIQSDTQRTAKHLSDVNASLASVRQALEQTGSGLATRLDVQEQQAQAVTTRLNEVQQTAGELRTQVDSLRVMNQSSPDLHGALRELSTRLDELEVHQSSLVGKIDADTQTMNTHLGKVNDGVNSLGDALKQVEAQLRARVEDQERKLNHAMTGFQSAQSVADTTQANMDHLNQLTQTINQLRDVVSAIGTKLGERVDVHETRLGELATRVNVLTQRKP